MKKIVIFAIFLLFSSCINIEKDLIKKIYDNNFVVMPIKNIVVIDTLYTKDVCDTLKRDSILLKELNNELKIISQVEFLYERSFDDSEDRKIRDLRYRNEREKDYLENRIEKFNELLTEDYICGFVVDITSNDRNLKYVLTNNYRIWGPLFIYTGEEPPGGPPDRRLNFENNEKI
jgi:hypothetical protein